MIISDFPYHKVDLKFSTDGWLKLTTFHKKGEEWTIKIITLSPESQDIVFKAIQERKQNENSTSNL